MARITNATIMEKLDALGTTLEALDKRIEALEKGAKATSGKKTSGKKQTSDKSEDKFDRALYLKTAKKLAKQGLIELRKNGAPCKEYRETVYKAMGLK